MSAYVLIWPKDAVEQSPDSSLAVLTRDASMREVCSLRFWAYGDC
jgi:hypothetical protein